MIAKCTSNTSEPRNSPERYFQGDLSQGQESPEIAYATALIGRWRYMVREATADATQQKISGFGVGRAIASSASLRIVSPF